MPKDGTLTADIKQVTDEFDSVVSVASLDTFFYVADAKKGYYAIEAFSEDTFSEPRAMPGLLSPNSEDFI